MNFRELIEIENIQCYPNSIVNEAKFSAKNIEKVVVLYSRLMGKKMGGEFKPLGFETYNRKWGKGKGFRAMNDKGQMLRFNWDEKFAKEALYELTTIDFWDMGNTDFQKPTRTVKLAPEMNVVQILNKIVSALLTGSIRESNEIFDEFNELHEARTKDERTEWALANGLPATAGSGAKYLRTRAAKAGLSEAVEVFLGSSETNSFEGELKTVEKKLDNTVYADPETVFEDIEDVLGLVASGSWRTLIVCGQGGLGKCIQADQMVNVKGL